MLATRADDPRALLALGFGGLKTQLAQQDCKWRLSFLSANGLQALLRSLTTLSSLPAENALCRKAYVAAAVGSSCLLTFVDCDATAEYILAHLGKNNLIRALVEMFTVDHHLLVKIRIWRLLGYLCKFSSEGSRAAVDALSQCATNQRLSHPLSIIQRELQWGAGISLQYVNVVAAFLNALLCEQDDVRRMNRRNELKAAGCLGPTGLFAARDGNDPIDAILDFFSVKSEDDSAALEMMQKDCARLKAQLEETEKELKEITLQRDRLISEQENVRAQQQPKPATAPSNTPPSAATPPVPAPTVMLAAPAPSAPAQAAVEAQALMPQRAEGAAVRRIAVFRR